MNDLTHFVVIVLVSYCLFVTQKLTDRVAFLEARARVQKIRADEIECHLKNPFRRVTCER